MLGEGCRHLCLSSAVCPHLLAPGPHRCQWRLHWGLQPGRDLEEDIQGGRREETLGQGFLEPFRRNSHLPQPDLSPHCSLRQTHTRSHTPCQLHKRGLLTRPSEASRARVGGHRNKAMLGRACVLQCSLSRTGTQTDLEAGPFSLWTRTQTHLAWLHRSRKTRLHNPALGTWSSTPWALSVKKKNL